MIKTVKKLWGSEEWLVNTELYCAKFLNLKNGYQSSLHYHKNKDETFYVLDGAVELELRDIKLILHKDDSYKLEPNTIHRFKTITRVAKILEVSTHHEDKDSYRIKEARKIQ